MKKSQYCGPQLDIYYLDDELTIVIIVIITSTLSRLVNWKTHTQTGSDPDWMCLHYTDSDSDSGRTTVFSADRVKCHCMS